MFEFTDMEWTCYVHICVFIKILWRGGRYTQQHGYTLKLVKATVVRGPFPTRARPLPSVHAPFAPVRAPLPSMCAPPAVVRAPSPPPP
jgi:hypothetical protein